MNENTEESEALRHLASAVAELPRSMEPPRDLWPGVAERLAPRPVVPVVATWHRWAYQAMAALFFMALGAALALSLQPGQVAGSPAAEAMANVGFEQVEADYRQAKQQLWLLATSRRDDLSPTAVRTVERNLEILEAAIHDLRGALDADPDNSQLEGMLLAKHRRGLDILQQLTAPPAQI
jgi:hypothetical protein